MSKSMVASCVKCPFYRREERQKIYCEGIREGTSIHLAFGDATVRKQYEKRYCKSQYRQCRIADMLDRKYRESARE